MKEQSVFIAALEREPADRGRFLDQACENNPGLRQRVERLIASHEAAVSFMDEPAGRLVKTVDEPPIETSGSQIGPYRLLQEIGQGGMGVVYMAEQVEPVRRKVALKIIKPGMDTRQVIARFEAERQALSLMDHPNIAKVLDAGTTGPASGYPGRPYFVMELVKGQPITEYCDQQHLTPRLRLELFLPVCQAIQHAHQKGIIHRDVKPSNVLVAEYDGRPVAKVIDFGVAKAVSQPLTEKTLFTGLGQIVGTLEYMSPEQARVNQLDVDTRSDIYSLGVLLYELLTGSTPIDKQRLRAAAWDEMLRMIREEEPPKPSTRLSDSKDSLPSISAQRHTEPAKLTKLVRGELDWIVMKALEKDRNRRYETANGFAADIQRYLNDEAVVACPPSATYRFAKFSRRNKVRLVLAGMAFLFLMLLGSSVGWALRDRSAREAELARKQTERRAKVAAQVESNFADVERAEREQKWPEALASARRAEAAVASGEADATTEQRVRERIKDLEFLDRLEQIRLSLVTGRNVPLGGGAPVIPLASFPLERDYTQAFRDYGVDVDALPVEASTDRLKARPSLAIPLAAALDDWVQMRREVNDWVVNVQHGVPNTDWTRLVAIARAIDSDPIRDRLRAMWGRPLPEVRDALHRLAESMDIRAQPPATLYCLWRTLRRAGLTDLALRVLRDAQVAHPSDVAFNVHLANEFKDRNDFRESLPFAMATVALRPDSSVYHGSLGVLHFRMKDYERAIAYVKKSAELDPMNARNQAEAGYYLGLCGKVDEAIAAYRKAVELDPKSASAHKGLGSALHQNGQLDEAVAVYRQAVDLEKKKGAGSHELSLLQNLLAGICNQRAWQLVSGDDPNSRDPKRAVDLAEEVAALDPHFLGYQRTLGVAYYRVGNWKAAALALERSRQLEALRSDSVTLFVLCMAHNQLGEEEKARKCYDEGALWRMGIGASDKELRHLCAEAADLLGLEVPPTLAEPPMLTAGPSLGQPAAAAIVDNGGKRGSKPLVWEFTWSDVPGASRYHLFVIGPNQRAPSISISTLTSSSYREENGGYVADHLRLGWRWKVRALVNGVWSDWSEERTFDVAPVGASSSR